MRQALNAALMRTAAIGDLSAQLATMAEVCIAALDAAVEMVRPNNTPEMVDRACKDVIAAAGISDLYRKRTGYSIGIGFGPGLGRGTHPQPARGRPNSIRAGHGRARRASSAPGWAGRCWL